MLVYTLKHQKCKLKLRGFGHFVINDISPSGENRLDTLDGQIMANWINGRRLRLYNLSLTTKMLDRIHVPKSRKEAQQEAKERATYHRAQCMCVN